MGRTPGEATMQGIDNLSWAGAPKNTQTRKTTAAAGVVFGRIRYVVLVLFHEGLACGRAEVMRFLARCTGPLWWLASLGS